MWKSPFTFFGIAAFTIGCGMNIVSSRFPEWCGWVMIAIGVIAFIVGIFRHKWKIKNISNALQINFDYSNLHKQFWSLESPVDKNGERLPGLQWEYRVEIINTSKNTLSNVRVTVQSLGDIPLQMEAAIFAIDKSVMMDFLHPKECRLVTVLTWPNPPIQVGMAFGDNAYGPLKITATANDTNPAIRIFNFNYEKTPMLFE